jgi:pimeloyl-ACP methyl ester carboxylesterase
VTEDNLRRLVCALTALLPFIAPQAAIALMRDRQFPALVVWGRNDPAFIAAGAEAYLRDLPNAELHLIDAGHFAVEENAPLVARYILEFMEK